jgi:hypothetical protein
MPDREPQSEVDEAPPAVLEPPQHEDIARRAYELWQERGCPHGCAEKDWFRAEQELAARDEPESLGAG